MSHASTNKELVGQYIADVVSGRRVVGKLERAAVMRHVGDLETAATRGFEFDEELAEQACCFFPLLKHTTGEYAGQPFELMPFQRFIVWCLFGWVRASDGMRRFRLAFISLARGNGKSPFAAGLLLLLFAFDCPVEMRAECYTAATKKRQAKIVFNEVRRFVQQNADLKSLIRVMATTISIPSNDSTLEPLGQDSENTDGLIPHAIIADELHAWQERHRELWEKLITALGKRRQPMLIAITTAGDDESELWEEVYDFSVQIVDPDSPVSVDDWFVFICEIDDGDDPLDERNWPKANPMLEAGVVKIDHLRSLARRARIVPASKNELVRYHCNKKVTAGSKLFTRELWAKGRGELPELNEATAHGGFDWGWRDDLAAFALAFPLDLVEIDGVARRRYALHVDAWCCAEGPRDLASEPWASWIRDGWLRVTPGNTTDTAAIYGRLDELCERYAIRTVAMDPNNCREFGSRIEPEYGITPFWFGQSHGKYNEPTRELATALQQDRIRHGDNPLLAWSAQNVIASEDSRGYIKPDKRRSKDKIDPICAAIMALSECIFAERESPGFYEYNDLEIG